MELNLTMTKQELMKTLYSDYLNLNIELLDSYELNQSLWYDSPHP